MPLQLMGKNKRRLLSAIRRAGTLSRSAIATELGLTRPAITELVKELKIQRLVMEDSVGGNRRGQPQKNLRLNTKSVFAIGVSIQNDACAILVVDFMGQPVAETHFGPPPDDPASGCLEIAQRLTALLASREIALEAVIGVGVAVTGLFLRDGDVIWTPAEMPGWRGFALHTALAQLIPLPIHVENDGSASAVGERMRGAGSQIDTFLYLYLAYGVGGGFVHRGSLYRGAFGNAAEVGLLIPHHPAIRPTLTSLAKVMGREHASIRPDEILAWHHSREPRFVAFLSQAVAALRIPLTAATALLDPAAIIIGGEFPPEIITELITRLQPDNPLTGRVPGLPQPRILAAQFGGRAAGLLGSALLPLHYFFDADCDHPVTELPSPASAD